MPYTLDGRSRACAEPNVDDAVGSLGEYTSQVWPLAVDQGLEDPEGA